MTVRRLTRFAAPPVRCPLQQSPCPLLLHRQRQHHPRHHPGWRAHPASAAAQCVQHRSQGFHLQRQRRQVAAANNTPVTRSHAPEGDQPPSHPCQRGAVIASPHLGPRALMHRAQRPQGANSWLPAAGSSAGTHSFAWQPPCVPTCACKPEDGLIKAHLPGGALKQLLLIGVLADQAVHHHLHTSHTRGGS